MQQQYHFFFLDTLEVLRTFPEIADKHRQLLSFQRQQIQFMMEFNASRGSFIQQRNKEEFAELSHIFCMAMDNWMSYQFMNGNESTDVTIYCKDIWSILRVLFTDLGSARIPAIDTSIFVMHPLKYFSNTII